MLSMGHFIRDILAQLHHQASFFSEEHAERLMADLREMMSIDWSKSKDLFTERKANLILSYGGDPSNVQQKPFAFLDKIGAAVIPVHGILINRFSGSYGSVTGYNFIRSQKQAALADPDVKSIVYDYNTYGGMAAGCFELSKELFDDRRAKPSLGIIDASCYSAGYFLGSAHSKLIAAPSSGVGSIGCVSMHVDYSEMLEKEGIKVTFIKSAEPKTDGNPYEPLSARAKKSIQTSVDYHATAFIDSVARNRNMDEADVRGTEARCYDPPEALELGLIDGIQSPADAVANFSISERTSTMPMTKEDKDEIAAMIAEGMKTGATTTATAMTQAISAGIASALPTALAAHETAKRDRRNAVMGLPEAEKRQKLAASLADTTDMTAEAIKPILAAAAEEKPSAAGNGRSPFHRAMDNTHNPVVGADNNLNGGSGEPGEGNGDGGGGQETDAQAAERLLGLYQGATGAKVIPLQKAS